MQCSAQLDDGAFSPPPPPPLQCCLSGEEPKSVVLTAMAQQLEECKKSLASYLLSKRLVKRLDIVYNTIIIIIASNFRVPQFS